VRAVTTEAVSTGSIEINFVYTLLINSYRFKSTWRIKIIKSIRIIMKRNTHEAVLEYFKVLSSDWLEGAGEKQETPEESIAAVTKPTDASLNKRTDWL
jgi:hypothetical protein